MLSMADEECSSDCESGWTLYLADHSNYLSPPLLPLPPSLNHALIGKNDELLDDQDVVAEEEEEEDLSMVSDASSGPPHFQEELDVDTTYNYNNNNSVGIGHHLALHQQYQHQHQFDVVVGAALPPDRSKGKTRQNVQDLPSFLDDTASSPFFNNFNNNSNHHLGGINTWINVQASMENNVVDFSQGYSTTYFQGQWEDYHHLHLHHHHFGFFQSSVPAAGTQFLQNQYGLNWPGMR